MRLTHCRQQQVREHEHEHEAVLLKDLPGIITGSGTSPCRLSALPKGCACCTRAPRRRLYQHVRAEAEKEGAAGLRLYADDGNTRAHATVGHPHPSMC